MPKKRELPYVPPSGKVEWRCTPTQRHLAEKQVTIVTPVSVHAQSWFEARELGSVAFGIPLERVEK
jgi:hypothetical protein